MLTRQAPLRRVRRAARFAAPAAMALLLLLAACTEAELSVPPVTSLAECPGSAEAELTLYPGVGHDEAGSAYDASAGHDIYEWLLRHVRS